MTIQVGTGDVAHAIEVASWAASMFAMLVMGVIVYFMVRPSRRSKRRRESEADAVQLEEMVRLMERMERRLETLERAIRDEPGAKAFVETGAERAEYRRTK